jgi:hypothetical protein
MELIQMAAAFMQGVGAIADFGGKARDALSGALADGIEQGFDRIKPSMTGIVFGGAFALSGVLLVGYGVGAIIDKVLNGGLPGVGFVISGVVLLAFGALSLRMASSGS